MILVSFGTRPEWIKIKPILNAFSSNNIPYKVLFTGQHKDLVKKVNGCLTLEIDNGDNRLDSIICSILNKNYLFDGVTSVLVQGDTTSSFAVALAAFHRQIKVIHLEAGLRTYNKQHPYPEEFNRRAISSLTDVHFCPTELTKEHLLQEKFNKNIFVVGNSVLDNLVNIKTNYKNKIIITLHRRENHDKIKSWFKKFEKLANKYKQYEFIFPLHPNPNVQKHKYIFNQVKVIEPLEYNAFTTLLADCRLVITDSGGIQEEASFLKKKCIVCRETTERPEALGKFSTLVSIKNLEVVFDEIIDNFIPKSTCPFGNGDTSLKVVKILKKINNNERLY